MSDINDHIQNALNRLDDHPWAVCVTWAIFLPFAVLPLLFAWLINGIVRGKWHINDLDEHW